MGVKIMIENYKNIRFFTPSNFKITLQYSQKTFIDALQDFTNFICKEYNLLGKTVRFDYLDFDPGRFSSNNNEVILNKAYFDIYTNCIRIESENPTLRPAEIKKLQYDFIDQYISSNQFTIFEDNNAKDKFIRNKIRDLDFYPMEVCGTLIHEITHALQFQKYKEENNLDYINIENPYSIENILYALQKTEREAYITEVNEIKKIANLFEEQIELMFLKYAQSTEDIFLKDYTNGLQVLETGELISEPIMENNSYIPPNKLEQHTTLYAEIQQLLMEELEFLKDFQDFIKNEDKYIKGSFVDKNSTVKYSIRNINGTWNIRLNVNDSEIDFALDNNICRVNQLYNKNNKGNVLSDIDEEKLYKYVNAFIKLYPENISNIKISKLIHTDKLLLSNYIKNHSSNDKFSFVSKKYSKKEYNLAIDILRKELELKIKSHSLSCENETQNLDSTFSLGQKLSLAKKIIASPIKQMEIEK